MSLRLVYPLLEISGVRENLIVQFSVEFDVDIKIQGRLRRYTTALLLHLVKDEDVEKVFPAVILQWTKKFHLCSSDEL